MRRRKLHLAFVSADRGVPVLGTKGGSTHIRELVNALVGLGAQVRILTTRRANSAARASVRAPVIDIGLDVFSAMLTHRIRSCSRTPAAAVIGNETSSLLFNQDLYAHLQRLHSRWGIDVIYERYSLWGYGGLRFARDHAIPFVLEVNAPLRLEQAQYRALSNTVAAEALEGQLFECADLVLVPSAEVRNYVVRQGARRGRVRVVPNAADPNVFRPARRTKGSPERDGRFVIGFVGSLKPWHGIEDLLRAFIMLRRRDPSYELLVVGDGPLRSMLERARKRHRLDDSVQVTGSVGYDEIPSLLQRMDVAVAPYPRISGFYFSPLKIYEYMAAGLPIVASAIGQIEQVLTHRKVALLHPPGSVRGIVASVEELRRRPALRARLGREARRLTVRKFTWQRNATRVLAMTDTLLRRRKATR